MYIFSSSLIYSAFAVAAWSRQCGARHAKSPLDAAYVSTLHQAGFLYRLLRFAFIVDVIPDNRR
jgi:hypothetical protein